MNIHVFDAIDDGDGMPPPLKAVLRDMERRAAIVLMLRGWDAYVPPEGGLVTSAPEREIALAMGMTEDEADAAVGCG